MAGLFAGMLPQVPGDPAAILRLADDLRRKSATVEEQDSSLRQVEWQLNDWEGKTVAACRGALQGVKSDVAELQDGYLQGSRALEYYAWQLRATQEEILKLRRELAALDDEAARNFALRGVAGVVEIIPRVHAIQRDYNQYCRQIAKEARDCAAQLYQGLHIEPVVLNEQNINIGRRERLTASELDRVRLELNNLDPRRMKQGKIGDCYYLASLMAVANSPQGRDFLAGCLRPHYGPDRPLGFLGTILKNVLAMLVSE
ncbi:hypothetical protein [Buchananella hordeovulneris]|uniref:hypothetical protein n=1 Tax=Buchananella hordeovulneris TaxID=52770 RepID=UPI000F5D9156|nr:hypothetical protein [Buchananella hordeovulneris]RRD43808.1 hypothetical protein EII13_05905 [Buchananella hordeovulneris]